MDWQLTCRVCLQTGEMVSFFDWDENNEELCDKYLYCCGVEINKSDSLPTLLCLNCVDRLKEAYQFKQQCLSSNEILKECLEEFLKTSAEINGNLSQVEVTETITITEGNSLLYHNEIPVEQDPQARCTHSVIKSTHAVVTKAPGPRKRGRPKKYLNKQGQKDISPCRRKKPREELEEKDTLTTLLASGTSNFKEEPENSGNDDCSDDPDFAPADDDEQESETELEVKKEITTARKRGRPRKRPIEKPPQQSKDNDGEDMLLRETIMAISEPIPEHILNPKPKTKYTSKKKKKYVYEKTHICETCGASFNSKTTLQAHIRRHLGIKPFVCSVCGYACVTDMELRRHMLRHTGVKPHKCRVCDRRYGDYSTRLKHERLHIGLRPYQCSLCGKAFTYSHVLTNHMLTHTGEKKFSCAPCNRKFTKAHHLKYHNKVHHKELYKRQQMDLEAKKTRKQIKVTGLSGELTGKMVDGNLQLIQGLVKEEDDDAEVQMLVVEDEENDMEKETETAVAGMQGGVEI